MHQPVGLGAAAMKIPVVTIIAVIIRLAILETTVVMITEIATVINY